MCGNKIPVFPCWWVTQGREGDVTGGSGVAVLQWGHTAQPGAGWGMCYVIPEKWPNLSEPWFPR